MAINITTDNMVVADQEFENKVVMLKKHLRSRMNGKTTEQMENGQIDYTQNYGVSLQHVKELAESLAYGADDCRKIWRLNIREAMLIAAISMPTEQANADEMAQWASYIHTPDMAEQASFFLFWRTTDIDTFINKVLSSDIEYAISIATFTLGRALQKGVEVSDITTQALVERVEGLGTIRPHEARGISLMLRQAARKPGLKAMVANVAKVFSASDDTNRQQIAFEVECELEA